MSRDAGSKEPNEAKPAEPKSWLVAILGDGRQLVQVDDVVISVPKYTNKYYHAMIAIRGFQSKVRGFLHVPRRQLLVDFSGYHEHVFVLMAERDTPAVPTDSVLGIEVLDELSAAEYESLLGEIREGRPR